MELYANLSGKRVGKYFVLFSEWAPAGIETHRLGVTAAKKTFHDAHERNRAKRLLREAFRLSRNGLGAPPRDFVLVARRSILRANCAAVQAEFERLATPQP